MIQHPGVYLKKGETERLGTILYNCCESIRVISILIYPFMPSTASVILQKIGCDMSVEESSIDEAKKWGVLSAQTKVIKGANLFNRY